MLATTAAIPVSTASAPMVVGRAMSAPVLDSGSVGLTVVAGSEPVGTEPEGVVAPATVVLGGVEVAGADVAGVEVAGVDVAGVELVDPVVDGGVLEAEELEDVVDGGVVVLAEAEDVGGTLVSGGVDVLEDAGLDEVGELETGGIVESVNEVVAVAVDAATGPAVRPIPTPMPTANRTPADRWLKSLFPVMRCHPV